MVGVLNELAEHGLVERAPDPGDRRRNVITITAHGRRHLRRLDKVLDDLHEELLAPLLPAERDQFVRLLTRLGSVSRIMGGLPLPPGSIRRRVASG